MTNPAFFTGIGDVLKAFEKLHTAAPISDLGSKQYRLTQIFRRRCRCPGDVALALSQSKHPQKLKEAFVTLLYLCIKKGDEDQMLEIFDLIAFNLIQSSSSSSSYSESEEHASTSTSEEHSFPNLSALFSDSNLDSEENPSSSSSSNHSEDYSSSSSSEEPSFSTSDSEENPASVHFNSSDSSSSSKRLSLKIFI